MADSFQTLAHLNKINDAGLADMDVTDLLNKAPVLQILAAVEASNGTLHEYVKETTAPTVGFRSVNDGRENSVSVDTLVTVTTKIMDATFAVDCALADNYKFGREAYLEREAMRHLRQAFFLTERQLFLGTVEGDASGFDGLADEATLDAIADARVIDATGTTITTAASVYLIRTDSEGVAVVAGNGGNLMIGETSTVRIAGSATGTFPAYYTPISGYNGFQLGSVNDAVRICNLTEDSGKGLTDDLIAQALEQFPADAPPTHIVGNRRSLRQLQQSRTATNATGAPAPFPSEAFTVPIVLTDSLINTEAILT